MSAPSFRPKTYVSVYGVLLALVLITVLVGYVDLGWGTEFVAVTIATIKASLVAMFFMHALAEKRLVWLVIAGALVWFLILVTLTMGDYITRSWLPFPGK
ncbi:MAG TPA: cytochrome C oxidase subunit IV family protein [Bryobacteraceae bacterium]|jgi:cytochrome c oxidase subunit 4|nr:cytochrome C oxidase subunit IV family protein [Bryobacteraceae bacterium]